MRFILIVVLFLNIIGCATTTPTGSSSSYQQELQIIKTQNQELKAQVDQNTEKLAKMEKALGNSLKIVLENQETSLVNRRNIAMIYNILKEMLDAIETVNKELQSDKFKSISKVTNKLAEHYKGVLLEEEPSKEPSKEKK